MEDKKEPKQKLTIGDKSSIKKNTSVKEKKPSIENFTSDKTYDTIPLPSKGECYLDKKTHISVAYLTAKDENLLTSPNLYKSGKLLDRLLKEKIMDKAIDPTKLLSGDRDAIILWLRATGYGPEYPIIVTDNEMDTQFETVVNLGDIKMKEFNLKGDENGYFDFKLPLGGNLLKFKFLSYAEEEELNNILLSDDEISTKIRLYSIANELQELFNKSEEELDEDSIEKIKTSIEVINNWMTAYGEIDDSDEEVTSVDRITQTIIKHIISIDGNEDKKFIKDFIENMRARDSYDFRKYIDDNKPGMDYVMEIERPENVGRGSLKMFLTIDQMLFLAIK